MKNPQKIHDLSAHLQAKHMDLRGIFMPIHFTRLLIGALLISSLVACGGGAPHWVEKGSMALNNDAKSIYGVGSIVGVKNEPLAWEAAENRARANLAKTFRTYTAYLMEDYAASTTAGNFTKTTEEQNVERAIKTFTAVTLSGVRPVDRYKDEDSTTYYVLTELSFTDMKEVIQQAQELDEDVREFVKKNAERVFKKLEKEEAKRSGIID